LVAAERRAKSFAPLRETNNSRKGAKLAKQQGRGQVHRRALTVVILLLACGVGAAGCRLIGKSGAMSDEIAACRQLSQRGKSAMDREDWQAAEAYFAEAIRAHSDDAAARRYYADVLWRRGAQQQALLQAEEGLRLAGDDPASAVQVGEMNLTMGRLDEAGRLANAALDAQPSYSAAWALRARVALREGRPDDALADLHRALEHAPGDRRLLLEVAETHRLLGRPQRALAALAALRETYPDGEVPAETLYLSGLALSALGRPADAIDAYLAAADRGMAGANFLASLAEARLQMGDLDAASHAAQQALAVAPGHATALAVWQRIAGIRTAGLSQP
jgi:tetratricopeptide (TPR) repeat protein